MLRKMPMITKVVVPSLPYFSLSFLSSVFTSTYTGPWFWIGGVFKDNREKAILFHLCEVPAFSIKGDTPFKSNRQHLPELKPKIRDSK